jgi:hypothetical protein
VAVAVGTRRLPGVAFEAQPPPPLRVLPRMDVAAFVGFAAAGPLDVPVPVESAAEFSDVFGGDAPLAWDREHGEQTFAQLAPAVLAFLRNGGRRAWVVRVAGLSARQSLLPVPGLVVRRADGDLTFASLAARSPGSWADALRLGAALESSPALLVSAAADDLRFDVEAGAATFAAGDLLRITGDRFQLFVVVRKVEVAAEPAGAPRTPGRTVLTITGDPGTALWLERLDLAGGESGSARYVDGSGRERTAQVRVPPLESPPAGSPPEQSEDLRLDVDVGAAEAPELGTLVRVDGLAPSGTAVLWLRAERIGDGEHGSVRVAGTPSWVLAQRPEPAPDFPTGAAVEQLTFELRASRGGEARFVLGGLGFAPGHRRYLGDLPTDEELYTPRELLAEPDPELWAEAATPRFPLAGGGTAAVCYPLGVDVVPGALLAPLHDDAASLERDGLARFGDSLFLDRSLRAVGVDALTAEAEYLRWQSPTPRRLRGLHTLFDLDEVTIVAVPDAVHGRWTEAVEPETPPAPPSVESPPSPPASPPELEREFVDCALHELLPTPVLEADAGDPGGSFALGWSAVDEPGAGYVLQEGTDPHDWDRAETIYAGPKRSIRLYGRTSGTTFYRVRAEAGQNVSAWSNGVAVGAEAGRRYELEPEDAYEPDVLLAVQRALLRVCAARGDLLAVLSTPEHYRGDAAIAHARRLRAAFDPRPSMVADPGHSPPEPGLDLVPPLDGAEQRALGFGALYHPWLALSLLERDDPFRRVAPDGTVAGVIARRAATRGAWIAPANDTFADVVALVRPEPREALAPLQDAQVNEIRQEPAGFMCLCEDTLIRDEDVRPINVRRLLSLVRRLVLLEGARYVFEPNDPTFRRGVERGFRELMQLLYMLGAFVGPTPEQAFRVNVGSPPNTPASLDAGRLIVELKLAPSRPLAFLLVRLVHSGERGFELETP